jgi:FAD:protein FMN transferase
MRSRLLCTIAMLLLAGCERTPPAPYQQQIYAFGTLVEIVVYGAQPEQAERAVADVRQRLEKLHADWHAWEPSTLTALNERLATGETAELEPQLQGVLERASELAAASGDRFNPAMGRLIRLWGFHGELPARPPTAAQIEQELARQPRMGDLLFGDGTVTSRNPAVRIDLGGFAKGAALNQTLELLAAHGIENALISIGGDLRVLGRPGERLWRIGIRHPRTEGLLASVEIDSGESVFTSGDYERFFTHEGVRYHHIIDPASGRPARGLISVTVLHRDAALADAASTALFVAGPQEWRATARALGVDQAMLVTEEGAVILTPALAQRLHFEVEPAPTVREMAP